MNDPREPVPHVELDSDVRIRVPRSTGHYGLVLRGGQEMYLIRPDGHGAGFILVAPGDAAFVLRAIEGSVLVPAEAPTASRQPAEAEEAPTVPGVDSSRPARPAVAGGALKAKARKG